MILWLYMLIVKLPSQNVHCTLLFAHWMKVKSLVCLPPLKFIPFAECKIAEEDSKRVFSFLLMALYATCEISTAECPLYAVLFFCTWFYWLKVKQMICMHYLEFPYLLNMEQLSLCITSLCFLFPLLNVRSLTQNDILYIIPRIRVFMLKLKSQIQDAHSACYFPAYFLYLLNT